MLRTGTRVARIHPLGGRYRAAWNELRSFGPTTSRFDHHPLPRRDHPSRSIAYLTFGTGLFACALAEFFQDGNGRVGPIDRVRRQPAITLFELATDLQLLDLSSGWVTRAAGNQAIVSGPRGRAREWSRAIYSAHEEIHGLAYASSVWAPGRCIALWERGKSALPPSPLASRTLDDPSIESAVAGAAVELGSYVV